VQLNTCNAYIAANKGVNNLAALYGVAMSMLCHYECTMSGKQKLLTFDGDFHELMGAVLGALEIEEGRSHVG
jgi:hypothetical protein